MPTLSDLLKPFTTAHIAESLGVHPDTVRAWKAGERLPDSDTLAPLAELIKIDGATLLAAITQHGKHSKRTANGQNSHPVAP